MIRGFMKFSNIKTIIKLSDFIEQNIKEVPKLMSRLDLIPIPSSGNTTCYDEFVQKRNKIYNLDASELVLWFASPRPITFLY